jgi:RHS repeat-associated protein
VQKTVTTSTATIMTDYLDGFQYVNHALNFFPYAEGFVDVKGTNAEGYNYFYVYNYTDHLGNIRVSYGFDPDTRTVKTLEENHYYPFGLKHTNYNTYKRGFKKEDPPTDAPPTSIPGLVVFSIKQVVPGEMLVYKYKYNGKEWQDELGLNVMAMDFRQYDPAIGRFNGMDRLTELVPSMSPYRFAFNNPNFWADPAGLLENNIEGLESGLLENNIEGLAYCSTCPDTPAFKPLIDDPNNEYVYDPETKTATEGIQLEEVVVSTTTSSQSLSDSNWWLIDWLPNRNANIDRPFNITLGAFGTVATTASAWLHSERKAFEKRGTKTATKKLNKYVKPSINKVNKFSKRLGVAGAAYSAGSLGYDIVSGQEITAGQVFDTALSIGLSLVAISNPIGLVTLGVITVIDMYGGFDGIKESLRMDTIILNEK